MIDVRASWPKTRKYVGTYIGMVMAGMLLSGCTQTKKPLLPQPPATQQSDRWGTEAAIRRVRMLSHEADNLAADSRQLPGGDAAEHSRLTQRVFTDLLQTLSLMGDPAEDRVLAQRLTIIQTARANLASGSTDLKVEPTIDTALRAAIGALQDISHADAFQQTDVGKDLDTLSGDLNVLDRSAGDAAMHRIDVASTVDLISKVTSQLAASLSARLTVEQSGGTHATIRATQPVTPATQPAVPETTTPTTPPAIPATQPTTPATEPAAPATPATPATPPPATAPDVTAPTTPATPPAAPAPETPAPVPAPAVPATPPAATTPEAPSPAPAPATPPEPPANK